MGWLSSLRTFFGASSSESPDSDFWYQPLGMKTASGVVVTPESAMRSSAVFACVRIISETVGSLPMILYRTRADEGKDRATDNPLYNLFRYQPNPYQTAMEFYEMMTAHCVLRGNAFALRNYERGRLVSLVPLHPDRMRVDYIGGGRLGYLYTPQGETAAVPYTQEDIFHLRGMSSDGRIGLSPIACAREAVGLALSADDYGARFFQNDAQPRGILTHPSHFAKKEMREEFKAAWQRAQSGSNRHRTALLEDGMKYEQLGLSNEDAQFLETRRYQVADISRIFRVPLVMLNETEKSTSWGTGVEQFMLAFVIHTMRPWNVRWEQAYRRDFLVDDAGNTDLVAEFLIDALLRGDTKTRYEAYGRGIQDGWLLRNEARAKENLNPLPGLSEPLTPQNMAPGARPVPAAAPDRPPAEPDEDDDEPSTRAAMALATAAAERVARRELRVVQRAIKEKTSLDAVYADHVRFVAAAMAVPEAAAQAYCVEQRAFLDPEYLIDDYEQMARCRLERLALAHAGG